jgi:hypothetical protein
MLASHSSNAIIYRSRAEARTAHIQSDFGWLAAADHYIAGSIASSLCSELDALD